MAAKKTPSKSARKTAALKRAASRAQGRTASQLSKKPALKRAGDIKRAARRAGGDSSLSMPQLPQLSSHTRKKVKWLTDTHKLNRVKRSKG